MNHFGVEQKVIRDARAGYDLSFIANRILVQFLRWKIQFLRKHSVQIDVLIVEESGIF